LQALHRLGGIALALVAIGSALAFARPREGRVIVLALIVTALLGTAIAASDGPVVAVLAHSVAASLAIGLLVAALGRGRIIRVNR